tara:strand:- start:348 stop:521 length:174 start_codon:yes stop_codon:yes gene_type:complete
VVAHEKKLISITLAGLLSCSAVQAQASPSKSAAEPARLTELQLKNLSQLNEVCKKKY